jgi:hypothetical protein
MEKGRHAAAVQRAHQRCDRYAYRRAKSLCDRYTTPGRLLVCLDLTMAARHGNTWQAMRRESLTDKGNYSSGVWVDVQNPDILYTIRYHHLSIDRRRQDV